MKKIQFTVAKKIYTGFFTVVVITALLGILSILNMEKLNDNSTDLTDRWMINLELINEINYLTEHISVLQHQYVLEPNNSEMKEIENNFTTTFSELDKKIEEYDGRITLEENRKNFDEFKQKWNEYKRMNGEFLELGKNVNILQGFKGNQAQKLEELLKKSDGMYKDMQETLNALKQLNHDGAVQTDDENNQVFASSIKIVISFLIVGLLAGVAIALVVSRSISKPLKTVRQDVEQVADGNLALEDVTVKNRDEIG
ncbi:MCP four helix bundle domain-containing protein [Bacillus andreraoultii]|uniref:MCP four helix bundle domain-containing protein n=1 Tax=Bacillus andreraoultii TaxID=1499685 RepID=UPI00067F2DC2|nr:MCP four helix bundle domain-containing protein [Bacillus andreraoultii]